jgi:hypothetical protein
MLIRYTTASYNNGIICHDVWSYLLSSVAAAAAGNEQSHHIASAVESYQHVSQSHDTATSEVSRQELLLVSAMRATGKHIQVM